MSETPTAAPGTDLTPSMDRGALTDVSLNQRMKYAQAMAASGLIPAQYRDKPANMLYAIEYGNMLGIHPLAAVTGVHVIEGKPTASSALMSALVRRAGHRLRVSCRTVGGVLTATASIIRSDDQDFEFVSEWTMTRATKAGLAGKAVWKNYPEAMLKSRAISEVAREACEEALCGVHYTPEELNAEVDEDENVVAAPVVEACPDGHEHRTPAVARVVAACGGVAATAGSAWTGANLPGREVTWVLTADVDAVIATIAAAADAANDIQDAEVVEEVTPITVAQSAQLHTALKAAGLITGADASAFIAETIGRTVASSRELTTDEAAQVLTALAAVTTGVTDPNGPEGPLGDYTPAAVAA